jgi:signal recognition particle subunit SRP54
MGGQSAGINLSGNPTVVLMSGLQGSGKTTFSGKLANHIRKKGKTLAGACDVYRPAAIDQLETLGKQLDIDGVQRAREQGPGKPSRRTASRMPSSTVSRLGDHGHRRPPGGGRGDDGRDRRVKKAINPQETLFVVDAMTGQDAVNTAKAFNDRLNIDGVVLTKLDGDTRGGAALSIRSVVDKPIKFIGTGEKMEALDEFHPDRMAGRILGMGDVVSLVERAQEQFDETQRGS